MNKVRIYGTLGPSCSDSYTLSRMFEEGMTGIRLNLSHTTLDGASELIAAYHKAASSYGADDPELLIDMQGPELRIGDLREPIRLDDGDIISPEEISLPDIVCGVLETVSKDTEQDVLIDDGRMLLSTIVGSRDSSLRVMRGGILSSRKSVALPGLQIDTPALTDADIINIEQASYYGVTSVMQPFVRGRDDLIEVRRALDSAGCLDVRLLAKIENLSGLANVDDLIPYCDEIVIARGDLGNSMELWELPAAQKRIAAACRKAGKDFMVVTQMLDSMMHRQVPTRAEVSDIFNAVLDGASSVMVTGETAAGDYPELAIRYLARTVREAIRYRG